MKNSQFYKKALVRRIKKVLASAPCGEAKSELQQMLDEVESGTWKGDYDLMFRKIDEFCATLFAPQKIQNKD